MHVYANLITQDALKRDFYYAFAEKKYPGLPNMDIITIDTEPFLVGDILVEPISVKHLKMPVLGFRFGKFTYITDANAIDDIEKEKIKGSEVLVLNALRHEKHISHFTLKEAVAIADELQIPQAYFTHISHQLGKHADVNATLPPARQLAFDKQILHF